MSRLSFQAPRLSVIIPTFNNVHVLARCVESWRDHAADQPVEIIVIEDGCRDSTPMYLETLADTGWGRAHLRWIHQSGLHELRCTNAGMRASRASLMMAWQDDMFLRADWLVPEILAAFDKYDDLGVLCLSRGLNCHPLEAPIHAWEDLHDERRLESTIGSRPLNWFQLQEVDAVIRPWVVRRACTEAVGLLDEAFAPTEWDETDLCFRIRQRGWSVATHGYERVGAYQHLGSTTIGALSDQYKIRVLRNGRLFHDRWDATIRESSARSRKRWWRPMTPASFVRTLSRAAQALTRAPVASRASLR